MLGGQFEEIDCFERGAFACRFISMYTGLPRTQPPCTQGSSTPPLRSHLGAIRTYRAHVWPVRGGHGPHAAGLLRLVQRRWRAGVGGGLLRRGLPLRQRSFCQGPLFPGDPGHPGALRGAPAVPGLGGEGQSPAAQEGHRAGHDPAVRQHPLARRLPATMTPPCCPPLEPLFNCVVMV